MPAPLDSAIDQTRHSLSDYNLLMPLASQGAATPGSYLIDKNAAEAAAQMTLPLITSHAAKGSRRTRLLFIVLMPPRHGVFERPSCTSMQRAMKRWDADYCPVRASQSEAHLAFGYG